MLLGISSAHLGQEDLEYCPTPLRASYANRATVLLHDSSCDPQTQAVADRSLGREKWLEDIAPMLRINAATTIGNRYSQTGFLCVAPFAKGTHSQEKSSAAWARVDSIGDQIGKHLPQLALIGQDELFCNAASVYID